MYKYKIIVGIVFLCLLIKIVTPFNNISFAAERNTDLDIITNVRITDTNDNDLTSATDVEKNSDIKLYYDFFIPDAAIGTAGDTLTIALPDEIYIAYGGSTTANAGATKIADIVLSKDNQNIQMQFTQDAFDNGDVTGYFYFDLKFNGDEIGYSDPATLEFDIGSSKTDTVTIDFNQPPPTIDFSKSGTRLSDKSIQWQLGVDVDRASVNVMIITDPLPEEVTLDENSVYLGATQLFKDTDYTYDSSTNVFTYTFASPVTTDQVITFNTTVKNEKLLEIETQGGRLTVTNTAELDSDGDKQTDDATVHITPKFISKAAIDNGDKSITWTVTVNESELTIDNAFITDTLPADLTLDTGTIKIDDSVIPEYTGVGISDNTYELSGQNLTVYLGNITTEKTISYVTDISSASYETQTDESYTNSVTLSPDPTFASHQASETITPNSEIIQKNGTGYARANGILSWEIIVNPHVASLDNVIINDAITTGQSYITDSFKIYEIGSGGARTDVTSDLALGTFTDSAALINYAFSSTIDKTYALTFNTQIDDVTAWKGNQNRTYSNTAEIFFGVTKVGEATANQPATINILKKSFSDYDYNTKLITWRMIINENKNALTAVVLDDTIESTQDYVPNSFVVRDESNANVFEISKLTYTNTAPDNESLSYNFGDISQTYTIEYQTTLEPDQEPDLYTNGNITLSNSAKITHAETNAEVTATGTITSDVISKDYDTDAGFPDNGDPFINWTIIANKNQVPFSQNVTISDTLPEGLRLDTHSIELHELAVNSGGATTVGSEVTIDPANYTYDDVSREFTFTLPAPFSNAYALTFTTFISDKSKSPFQNTATLSPESYTPTNDTHDNQIVVNSFGAGADAYFASFGTLTAIKKAQGTGALLEGAVFQLSDEFGNVINTVSTDSNGEALFELLPLSHDYTVKEINEPTGYNPNPANVQTVTIDNSNKNPSIEFENEIIKGNIQFTKHGETNNPLEGVVFTLYKKDDDSVVGTAISDQNGIVTFSDIEYGDYYVQETSTIEKYDLNTTQYDVNIRTEGATESTTPAIITNSLSRGTVTLTKKDGTLSIKDDVLTITQGTNTVTEPAKFRLFVGTPPTEEKIRDYAIANNGASYPWSGTELVANQEYITGIDYSWSHSTTTLSESPRGSNDGILTVSGLIYQDYYFVEVDAPNSSYLPTLGAEVSSFTVDENSETLTVVDEPIPSELCDIILNKTDGANTIKAPAEFELYSGTIGSGTIIDDAISTTLTTGKNYSWNGLSLIESNGTEGKITIFGMPYGDYYFVEKKAPSGYVMPTGNNIYTTFTANSPAKEVLIVNEEDISFSLGDYVWIDANRNGVQDINEAYVNDVLVTLYKTPNIKMTSALTGSGSWPDGYYRFNNLSAGDYFLTFSSLPAGYTFTLKDLGGNDTMDSDVNDLGQTIIFTINEYSTDNNNHFPHIDAGIYNAAIQMPPTATNNYLFLLISLLGLLVTFMLFYIIFRKYKQLRNNDKGASNE